MQNIDSEKGKNFYKKQENKTEKTETEKTTTIPVIEEELEIKKKQVETGHVLVSKSVSEHEESVNVPLLHDEVDVERVKINSYVDTLPPPVRYEGDIMIIPVLKEVVEKRTILVEELRVSKRQVQTQETMKVKLKKEEVKLDRNSAYESSDNFNK
ncbi:hypothetical protein BH23BAC1_BH23BAC1_20350 [soil metagenome]